MATFSNGVGLSTFMASAADGSTALTNTAQAVCANAGRIFGYYIQNPNAAVEYISFYDVPAALVTVGTTIPKMQIPIGSSLSANLSLPYGIQFNTACSVAATDSADGNGAPATALNVVIWYVNGVADPSI
jgi:hypothetical protein